VSAFVRLRTAAARQRGKSVGGWSSSGAPFPAGRPGQGFLTGLHEETSLALADQVDRAHTVFERAADFANDLGLLAEEVEPETGELLGSLLQTF
jgi:hypothetical protein